MPETRDPLEPIVTDDLFAAGLEVIHLVRQDTQHAYLLDAKIGNADSAPLPENEIASTYNTSLSNISTKMAPIIETLSRIDQEYGNPLSQIAQRANDAVARTAIINRHNRRPPLYSEDTIITFVKLGLAEPRHSPLIRAAGYASPPPVVPRNHDMSKIITHVAAYMARSNEPRNPDEIQQFLGRNHHRELSNWPQLDLTLFIERITGIRPDQLGFYDPDQPWGRLISARQLVANTILRIFARDQQPRTTAYLATETARLVGHFLPQNYNTIEAIRAAAYASDEISWQGLKQFGLKEWEVTGLVTSGTVRRRSRTGDIIYAFLMQHGPTDIVDVVQNVHQTANTKPRTVQEAINHDPANRFIRITDRRVAANPIPQKYNPDASSLMVVPNGDRHRPGPILQESELLWLTRYVQALNTLQPPVPTRVAVTRQRAAGSAQDDDALEITVVVEPNHLHNLEPRLIEIGADTTEVVPAVRLRINIMSPKQWVQQQTGKAHHNVWLAPDEDP